MTLKEIEKELAEHAPIRIRGILKKRRESPSEFMVKFFTKWNLDHDTIYVNAKRIQSEHGLRRSIGDLYLILKYYYPKITLEELRDIIYNELFKTVPIFRTSMCSQIEKRVFYQGKEPSKSAILNDDEEDEWELTIEQWKTL